MNDKRDILDYLISFKNPLDKKYRWEVNVYLKKGAITQKEAERLLNLTKKASNELITVVRNGIPVDAQKIGRFYLRQAARLNNQRIKKDGTKDFSI